ncbi:DUF3450 domain-containing protein [Endozoicomonadaceae bacterium StTr2]
MLRKPFRPFSLMLAAACFVLVSHTASGNTLNKLLEADRSGLDASQQAQERIQAIDSAQQELLSRYLQTNRELRLAQKYNQQLNDQVARLEQARDALEQKRSTLRQTRTRLSPLMDEMLVTLEKLVKADTPFLKEERSLRLQALKKTLVDPTLPLGEKMARLLEAYQVELSYGYSVASYPGQLDNQQLVTFLRAGRLGYYYLTPDDKAAIWISGKGWQSLDKTWIPRLQQAMRTASGEGIPQLMTIPRQPEILQ